jgi:hypothetical protein
VILTAFGKIPFMAWVSLVAKNSAANLMLCMMMAGASTSYELLSELGRITAGIKEGIAQAKINKRVHEYIEREELQQKAEQPPLVELLAAPKLRLVVNNTAKVISNEIA